MIAAGSALIVVGMAVLRRFLVLVVALGWMGVSLGGDVALAQDGPPPVPAVGQEAVAKPEEGERPLPDIPERHPLYPLVSPGLCREHSGL